MASYATSSHAKPEPSQAIAIFTTIITVLPIVTAKVNLKP